jgi:hypothetical protein
MPLRHRTIRVEFAHCPVARKGNHLVNRIRNGKGPGKRSQGQVRIGRSDSSVTGNAGMVAVTELLDRLDAIGQLDAAVGAIKQRGRGFGAGQLLVGIASAQLAGQDFLVGLDRYRADAAGQLVAPVPGCPPPQRLVWPSG